MSRQHTPAPGDHHEHHGSRIPPRIAAVAVSVLLLLTAVKADEDPVPRGREGFLQRRSEIINTADSEFRELAEQCHQAGLTRAAEDITAIRMRTAALRPQGHLPPPKLMQLPLSESLPDAEKAWRRREESVRTTAAAELYRLARSALRQDYPTVAYTLVKDTVAFDPDHRQARAVLGQQVFHDPERADDPTYTGEWVSAFEADMRGGSNPHINHEIYGWIPRTQRENYEAGTRLWKGRWIPAEREAEFRRDFRNAWEVRSEHFLIRTNAGLEEGVALSRKLEEYYEWFQLEFAAFFETPAELEQKFREAQVRRRKSEQPLRIEYYATRDDYEKRIRGMVPPGVTTNGFYWQKDQIGIFFRPEDPNDLGTVYHEATHQILDISSRADRVRAGRLTARRSRSSNSEWVLCRNSNFCLVEGIACYAESFRSENGRVTAGDPSFVRFVAAQYRLLTDEPRDQYYVPMRGFLSLGQDDVQRHPRIASLYSQASGLVHFLMHYRDGIYRDDFVRLLLAMYRPDLKNLGTDPSLEAITGVSFDELDRQYAQHMRDIALAAQTGSGPDR